MGDYLVEQIRLSASRSESPVAGESWKKALSPAYKKRKQAEGLDGVANLEEHGDLLDDLDYTHTEDGIEIGWTGDQAGKADGHANLSGDSDLPQRRLIPDVGQDFKTEIQDEIEKIVADAITDSMEFQKDDFEDVETKTQLYDALDEYFPDMSRSDIRDLVARTPDLARMLDELDIFNLL